jgi:hypothetical protein
MSLQPDNIRFVEVQSILKQQLRNLRKGFEFKEVNKLVDCN